MKRLILSPCLSLQTQVMQSQSSISIAVNNRFIIIPEHEVVKIKKIIKKEFYWLFCWYCKPVNRKKQSLNVFIVIELNQ
jgi:hypothetical protein